MSGVVEVEGCSAVLAGCSCGAGAAPPGLLDRIRLLALGRDRLGAVANRVEDRRRNAQPIVIVNRADV